MTTDQWFHAGTLMSIGVSLLILTRFLVALVRGFVTGPVRGYRQERPLLEEPPAAPDTDIEAILGRVDESVRALRTSTILLTVTTDSLAAILTAAVEPPTTDDPAGSRSPAASPPTASRSDGS